jgi:two-component system torCAD operon response regulator TorR
MKPVVLVLDDEPGIRTLLTTALEEAGYEVLTAASVREFEELAEKRHVDVYLVDVGLPDGNGFSLVRDLRPKTDSGIILLTGRDNETDHVVGLELGADDYVTKPFRPRELCARVGAVYRRTGRSRGAGPEETPDDDLMASADHSFEGYRVYLSARRVLDDQGNDVDLTTAEFELLAALLRSRGQVLSRDQIMAQIKGREWESYDRAIDGLVSRLRRKLPAHDRPGHFIRTVHGVGYSFTG